jgi:MoaA/NifB/PqqE/SkfB family radical SAM enzyme
MSIMKDPFLDGELYESPDKIMEDIKSINRLLDPEGKRWADDAKAKREARMTARQSTRISTDRTKLQDVIPLSTPYLVFVDPSNMCNLRCQFCPTGNRKLLRKVGRVGKMMEWITYTNIIQQLTEFPKKIKTLRLYQNGEPLLNPLFAEMVGYARYKEYFNKIDTTTNGTLLNPYFAADIIRAGLDKIHISVPVNWDEKYRMNISEFHYQSRGSCEVFAKINGDLAGEEGVKRFLDAFGPISDEISVEHTANCWPGIKVDGVNETVGIYGQPIEPDILCCAYPMYTLSINSNGTVNHCFVGWSENVLLGDTKTERLVDIWNGKRLRDIQIAMLKGERHTLPDCGVCEHHLYGKPDNIDGYREQILKRMGE